MRSGWRGLGVVLSLLWSTATFAAECSTLVQGSVVQARDPQRILGDLDGLSAFTDFAVDHAEQVFLDPEGRWRQTVSAVLNTRLVLGAERCRGGASAELSGVMSHTGLVAAIEDRRSGLVLSLRGLGRMDSSVLREPGAGQDGLDEQATVDCRRGLLGVSLQVTRWVELGFAWIASSTASSDPQRWPALASVEAGPSTQMFELGSPRFGLLARVTRTGATVDLGEVGLHDVGLTGPLRGSLVLRTLAVEGRNTLALELLYRWFEAEGRWLDFGVHATFEDDTVGLRYARAKVENLLVESTITRTSSSRLGARVEQSGGLTVYRGRAMRAASGAEAAVGVEYRAMVGLRSPYIYVFFDFGVGFNQPEMLDLLPYAVNSGMVSLGLNLAQRW